MSVEKHAVRLAEVYKQARKALTKSFPNCGPDAHAGHDIAMLLVQQALSEDILAEWLKPEPEGIPVDVEAVADMLEAEPDRKAAVRSLSPEVKDALILRHLDLRAISQATREAMDRALLDEEEPEGG